VTKEARRDIATGIAREWLETQSPQYSDIVQGLQRDKGKEMRKIIHAQGHHDRSIQYSMLAFSAHTKKQRRMDRILLDQHLTSLIRKKNMKWNRSAESDDMGSGSSGNILSNGKGILTWTIHGNHSPI
jgi:hypothetical protein